MVLTKLRTKRNHIFLQNMCPWNTFLERSANNGFASLGTVLLAFTCLLPSVMACSSSHSLALLGCLGSNIRLLRSSITIDWSHLFLKHNLTVRHELLAFSAEMHSCSFLQFTNTKIIVKPLYMIFITFPSYLVVESRSSEFFGRLQFYCEFGIYIFKKTVFLQ